MNCKYTAIERIAKRMKEQSKGQVTQEQARKTVIKHLERAKRRKEG